MNDSDYIPPKERTYPKHEADAIMGLHLFAKSHAVLDDIAASFAKQLESVWEYGMSPEWDKEAHDLLDRYKRVINGS